MADYNALMAAVPDAWADALRSSLSMRVTVASGSVYRLPDQLGTEELKEDWIRGISFFNTYPPITFHFTLANLPDDLIAPVWMCAEFFSGQRLQWFEAGAHFQYNDNGISMIRDRQAKYAGAGGQILQFITTSLKPMKTAYQMGALHMAGQFSSTISFPRSLTRGLRGTRLGFG